MLKFIENVNDFYASNYFDDNFIKKVIEKSGYSTEALKDLNKKINQLKKAYFDYKGTWLDRRRNVDRILDTHTFHSKLLNTLCYDGDKPRYQTEGLYPLNEKNVLPVRHILYKGDKPHLFIMEMRSMIREGDTTPPGLFEQKYDDENGEEKSQSANSWHRESWKKVFVPKENEKISPSIINQAISEIFLQDELTRPEYILMLAGNEVYLMQHEKWKRESYLRINLEDLFDESAISANKNFLAAFYILLAKNTLVPESENLILEQLDDDAHKAAYSVTKELKTGVISAVEKLANEAVAYLKKHDSEFDQLSEEEGFVTGLKDDCLTIIYRLLFVFYAEARPELKILPTNDSVYQKGYSLDKLRDLEQVPLLSEDARNGYFFDDTLKHLFDLLYKGFNNTHYQRNNSKGSNDKSFIINPIDSPLFDNDRLKVLKNVRFRNKVWQNIIRQLSLTQQNGKQRGRISYANLGIIQLGRVYEGLLAYRGFFTEEDYIEVHHADPKKREQTFVVPRSRRNDFKDKEVRKDPENPEREFIIPKGSFVYRLSGRDRQRSASYYTPEVLTKNTVKYTLKPLYERLEKQGKYADELLNLKILEPAMGAAAFHNEVIDQLAEKYLERKQEETKEKINPGDYNEELQKVKAYIANHNVYGVDLNSTAIELGKIALWLNAMHQKMEVPFFGKRLGVGNALLGAWFKVYKEKDVVLEYREGKQVSKKWWEIAPKPTKFNLKKNNHLITNRKKDEIYHFLLGDKEMVPSSKINMLKDDYPQYASRVAKWKRNFTRPISKNELPKFYAICNKIDQLLDQHYRFQSAIYNETYSKTKVWKQKNPEQKLIPYDKKEELAQKRNKYNAPYYKLKKIMDYWMSLWFWDVRHADELPTREQYLNDISHILDMDMEKEVQKLSKAHEEKKQNNAGFPPSITQTSLFPEARQKTIKEYKSKKQQSITDMVVNESHSYGEIFKTNRLQRINEYSDGYEFFHYPLEFIEVFAERGGFDVIVGNPPWIKVEFEEKFTLAEKFPELLLRKTSAPETRKKRNTFFEKEGLKELYIKEYTELESSAVFYNAIQNFPLLKGQQSNSYKCFIENAFQLNSEKGTTGMLHPQGIYDDPKGIKLRKELYQRLLYHFQFRNQLMLFPEIGHRVEYGIHIYSGSKKEPNFYVINNLFHPITVDGCFKHQGETLPGGIKKKDKEGNYVWNMNPHKDRIIHYTEKELKILAKAFENSNKWQSAKLVSIHTKQLLNVLEKLSQFQTKVEDFIQKTTVCWDETFALDEGILRRETKSPDMNNYELIYSGPHIYVANPLYKTPKAKSEEKADYDEIDLTKIEQDYLPRTNYVPDEDIVKFTNRIKGFDEKKLWINYYKLCFSKMLSLPGERTLQPAIVPPKVSHIFAIISIIFKEEKNFLELAGLTTSIILDFFIKSIGSSNLTDVRISSLPLGIKDKYKKQLILRTLLLNCLNSYYSYLWNDEIKEIDTKPRSIDFSNYYTLNNLASHTISREWSWNTPLRSHFERRMARVEIDVISAMALGLNLEELILIYKVQFPVLQQNEDETFYDQNGRIVFTVSKGLSGTGVDRKTWNKIKDKKEGETYKHTVDPQKSELYGGEEIVYEAPFFKCDRILDYKKAWAKFEKELKEE
ncbi:MAG: Eco57I restriction-modification methylase domain-containing protein [bacterium]